MKIKFCGAAREVTGSSHLITLDNGMTILLDCGLYQGADPNFENFNRQWQFDPKTIDFLIVSHAHIDHTGRIPKLYKDGFRGDIFCTSATRDLCAIMMMDSAKIQQSDRRYASKHKLHKEGEEEEGPLYGPEDVTGALGLMTGFPYERWFNVGKGVRAMFRDAGHILGSANVTLEITEGGKTTTIGFSGDIGRPGRPILRDPIPMEQVDYMICESTYGDKEHQAAPEEKRKLLQIIQETCVERKGKLLIPAFSVGRTQEVVFILDQLESEGLLPRIPVYVDSPLAVNATNVFEQHPECFDAELHRYMLEDENPFGFGRLQYIRTSEASKRINKDPNPAIIIASSGMMNAGRIQHHLAHCLESPKNGLLVVGYCAPNTLGGKLRGGDSTVYLLGKNLNVNLQVYTMDSFSAHGDRNEMYDFLKNQKPGLKKLFLVHGDYEVQQAFQTFLGERGFSDIEIPALGDVVTLG